MRGKKNCIWYWILCSFFFFSISLGQEHSSLAGSPRKHWLYRAMPPNRCRHACCQAHPVVFWLIFFSLLPFSAILRSQIEASLSYDGVKLHLCAQEEPSESLSLVNLKLSSGFQVSAHPSLLWAKALVVSLQPISSAGACGLWAFGSLHGAQAGGLGKLVAKACATASLAPDLISFKNCVIETDYLLLLKDLCRIRLQYEIVSVSECRQVAAM